MAVNVTLDAVDEVTVTPVHALNVDTHPSLNVSDSVYVPPGVNPAGPHVYEPTPAVVETTTAEPPSSPVRVKSNDPSPPTAVFATEISGRLTLVKSHVIVAPGSAMNVTLDAVDDVTSTPSHELKVDTHPSWTVSDSV